jgi:hypothetical protein
MGWACKLFASVEDIQADVVRHPAVRREGGLVRAEKNELGRKWN